MYTQTALGRVMLPLRKQVFQNFVPINEILYKMLVYEWNILFKKMCKTAMYSLNIGSVSSIICSSNLSQCKKISIDFQRSQNHYCIPCKCTHARSHSVNTFISIASTEVTMMLNCITSVQITALMPPCKKNYLYEYYKLR